MKLKNKNICLYILYCIIFLLTIFIIYYCYKILITKNKKKHFQNKKEHFQNTITYESSKKVIDIFTKDKDDYVKKFSKYDLIARKVDTPTEYIKKISNCAKDFTETQKNIINNCCKKADEFLKQYNDILDGKEIAKIDWKFALTDKQNEFEYEDGLPHTRNDTIFLSDKMIPETETPDLVNTLIHEKIHVYQKVRKKEFDEIIGLNDSNNSNNPKLTFKKIVYFNTKKRANPDLDEFVYQNNKNEVMQCYYNSDTPNSIQDVTCLHNNSINEHPYEYIAYTIANKYNEYLMKKYINI